jgi:hypothetical protein
MTVYRLEHAKLRRLSLFPVNDKDTVMFKPGTVAPEVLEQSERLNAVSPYVVGVHRQERWGEILHRFRLAIA